MGFDGNIEHQPSLQFPHPVCMSFAMVRMVATQMRLADGIVRLQGVAPCAFVVFPDCVLSDTIIDTSMPERMVHIRMMPVWCPPGAGHGKRGLVYFR